MSILLDFDPEAGDLGRGVKVTTLEFAIVAPHVASILNVLVNETTNRPRYMKYAFEIWLGERNLITLAINDIEKQLPERVAFYAVDGNKVFDLRGSSGGVVSALIVYLIAR